MINFVGDKYKKTAYRVPISTVINRNPGCLTLYQIIKLTSEFFLHIGRLK